LHSSVYPNVPSADTHLEVQQSYPAGQSQCTLYRFTALVKTVISPYQQGLWLTVVSCCELLRSNNSVWVHIAHFLQHSKLYYVNIY